jgi:hypothetical protein
MSRLDFHAHALDQDYIGRLDVDAHGAGKVKLTLSTEENQIDLIFTDQQIHALRLALQRYERST